MSAVWRGDLRYEGLLEAAAAPSRVTSLTHGFYRYPARFGERFVREAIVSFSRRGDMVLDPFCGGGTTVVEALSQGRQAAGSDLSQLALFIAEAKTTPLSKNQLDCVGEWLGAITTDIAPLLGPSREAKENLAGTPGLLRNLIVNLCALIATLPRGATQRFARTLLLRTAQWALDGKEEVPTPTNFVQRLHLSYEVMRKGMNRPVF
ncbi:DNA methyltransferase [Polaromonas sp.]|uniref:DNA methyltransferase n=1 Tax=Polaromonas sp. TaxID=1869339 RepID=UPI0032672B17